MYENTFASLGSPIDSVLPAPVSNRGHRAANISLTQTRSGATADLLGAMLTAKTSSSISGTSTNGYTFIVVRGARSSIAYDSTNRLYTITRSTETVTGTALRTSLNASALFTARFNTIPAVTTSRTSPTEKVDTSNQNGRIIPGVTVTTSTGHDGYFISPNEGGRILRLFPTAAINLFTVDSAGTSVGPMRIKGEAETVVGVRENVAVTLATLTATTVTVNIVSYNGSV